jgi:cobalamin biosynthetic protein CobC
MHGTANPATPVRLRARPPTDPVPPLRISLQPMASPPEIETSPRHGGDLAFATASYGTPRAGWLDLSTGINPTCYPISGIAVASPAGLPDKGALDRLIAAARTAYGLPADAAIAAVPGSEVAIGLLPLLTPDGTVAVVGPTYGSHARAWQDSARRVIEVSDIGQIPTDVAIAVVINPNNPDGRTVSPGSLVGMAQTLGRRGGLLIVDEAFADATPEISLAPTLRGLPAVILRSVGKFYGLAGLRLGFVAGEPNLVSRLASILGDWPVSSAALAIGTQALSDRRWRDATRANLKEQSKTLRSLLVRHGLAIRGHTNLFVLIEDADAAGLHRRLAEHGIWTRAFAHQPTWLRLGLPGTGMDRLDRALTACR